jgi:glycosyltransferase involved in cell wall biosynthesis
MRLGVLWVHGSNAQYRAFQPARAMSRRGHTVVWPPDENGEPDPQRLTGCDVVHVYRREDAATRQVLAQLARAGTAITYDNDDDLAAIPKESPNYRERGGAIGQRIFAETVKTARLAHCVTTTCEPLAGKYRRAGVRRVEVIGNYLTPDVHRGRTSHDGIVIGWIAGVEHEADAARLKIADALRRVTAKHCHVRVECIGVDLGLTERYRHDALVRFEELPARIGGFDIGIAPMADIGLNRSRSDIKLKEYAASGIPWLASPVGPYLELGEAQGGRPVPDDGWFDALDRLVTYGEDRRRLGRQGEIWARGQTIDAVADRWEQVFAQVAPRDTRAPRIKLSSGASVRISVPRAD